MAIPANNKVPYSFGLEIVCMTYLHYSAIYCQKGGSGKGVSVAIAANLQEHISQILLCKIFAPENASVITVSPCWILRKV